MNWHKVLTVVLPPAVAASTQLPGPWAGIISGILSFLGTVFVRPSQVSNATGNIAGKLPGKPAYEEPRQEP